MKAGKLLAVVVAFMMIFALLPTAVHALPNPDPPMYVWVAEEWTDGGEGNVTDDGFTDLVIGLDAFTSIQDAIDAVAAGGIIKVLPGTYEEDGGVGNYSLRITKDGITLQGVNSDGDPLEAPIEDYDSEEIPTIEGQSSVGSPVHTNYLIEANNVTLAGLRILPYADNVTVLRVTGSNFTLLNCIIDDLGGGSDGNLWSLRFVGEDAISAHVEGNRLEGTLQFILGAGEESRIIGNEVYASGSRSSLNFRNEGSVKSILVQGNKLTGHIYVDDGAGAGSQFINNEIHAEYSFHFSLQNVPGDPEDEDSVGVESVTIVGNSFLGSWTGSLIYLYDNDDSHPNAMWMFDIFNSNDVGEAYAIVKDMETFELREVSDSSRRAYSTLADAQNHAQAGDTIFSFLPAVDDGTITLNFDPDEMPDDSSLVMVSHFGGPIVYIPVSGLAGGGTHTASVQFLEGDDGGLPIPDGYEFLARLVLTIEGPGATDGQFVDDNPAQVWLLGIPDEIDTDALLLLRYNEATGEWEEQEKEIDEDGTLIFYTPQWSDFVFLSGASELPEPGTGELPATGTAVMWLIPFGALLLLAGWGLRKRAVA